MSGLLPPLAALNPGNHGPAVIVVTCAFIIVSILFVATRVVTTFALKRSFGWDDALLVLATVIGLAQSIVISKSATYGLGRYIEKANPFQLDRYFKYAYAGSLLSLFAQACAKASVIHLMSRLSAQKSSMQRRYVVAQVVVALWLVFSVFGLAFQCDLPMPWLYRPNRCAGSGALWYPVLIIDILTDAVLSFIFAPVLFRLQMKLGQRLTIISLFAFRIVVCAAEIAQLALLAPALKATDTTRAMVVPVILGQCVMNLSILAAAAPSLHRFLNELHSKGFASTIPATQYELSRGSGNDTSAWRTTIRSARNVRSRTEMSSTEKDVEMSSENNAPTRKIVDFRPDLVDRIHNTVTHEPQSRTGSQPSIESSDDAIIRQTKTWNVAYENGVEPVDLTITRPAPAHQSPAL